MSPPDGEAQQGPGLFKEINALRQVSAAEDEEAAERAKYHDGFFAQIAMSKKFEFSTLGMIVFNALCIGYDADYTARWGKPSNLNDGPIGFIIIENMFATYFTIEVMIRFLAYKIKTDIFFDAWFVFDSVLVSMMVIETWILPYVGSSGPLGNLSIFRLLRLLRITRISRIMRAVPEAMVIVRGMAASTRAVLCNGFLLTLIMYTFCILFTDAYHERDHGDEDAPEAEALFGTMGKSMFSLFIFGTILDDVTYATNSIRETENTWMLTAFICFILISSFMLLNMLIGVLVEVVGATAEGERMSSIETNIKEAIAQIFDSMDKDCNHEISRQEFMVMMNDERVAEALSDLDIESSHFHVYAELFFRPENVGGLGGTGLSYEKLTGMIFRLRPGGFVSALDFASFAKSISSVQQRVKNRLAKLEQMCHNLLQDGEEETWTMLAAKPDANYTQLVPATPTLDMSSPMVSPSDRVCAFDQSPRTSPQASPTAPPSSAAILEALGNADRKKLENIASVELVEEIRRRIGNLEQEAAAPPLPAPSKEESQYVPAALPDQNGQAFMTLGVPLDETVYV